MKKAPFILAAVLAAASVVDLVLAPRSTFTPLRATLKDIPMDLLGPEWTGVDTPMPEETLRIASVSDYLQRSYRKEDQWLWFYVGYVPGWNPSGIHYPDVCFPAHGLIRDGEEEDVTVAAPGIPKELRFKESHWRDDRGGRRFTMTTFYYRGRFEPSELKLRRDRFLGIDYFAIITVSGSWKGSLEATRSFYHDLLRRAVPELLQRFPG